MTLIIIQILLLTLTLFASRAQAQPAQAQQSAQFIPIVTIGAEESGPIDGLIGSAMHVTTDTEGRIIVFDGDTPKSFEPDGTFRYVIQEKGRGPGEILNVSTAFMSGDDLWVADYTNARISIFDSDTGEFLDSHFLVGGHFPKRGLVTPNGFVLLQRQRDPSTGEPHFLYEIDLESDRILHRFGTFDETWSEVSAFRETAGNFQPGNICLTPTAELLYAPALYSGLIFGFERGSAGWTPSRRLQGQLMGDEPFAVSDEKLVPKSESRGLFCLDDGRVLHFSVQQTPEKHLIAELFAADGDWIAAAPVEGVLFPETEYWDFNVHVPAIDPAGRFLIVDQSPEGYAQLRVGELEWDALEQR